MPDAPPDQTPTMFPYFAYRDAGAAIAWLAAAFGFEQALAVPNADGAIIHAELRFGGGAIMLGTATAEQRAQLPSDRPVSHGVYVYVADVDAHYERAKAAGARIVFAPEDTPWGTRRYRALDLDGYEWSFGSYRPAAQPRQGWDDASREATNRDGDARLVDAADQ